MRILVADKFEESGLEALNSSGFHVVYSPDLKEEALLRGIEAERAEGLIVRSTRVTEGMMSDSLKLIVRAGAGFNTIDIEAARQKGIRVSNCPGKNARAVAELTFGLILALDRRIPDNVIQLREGNWNKKEFGNARGLYGRTIGVIGVGNIGQIVLHTAKAFGMRVVAFSLDVGVEGAAALDIDLVSSASELAERSDIVTVHCALTPDTEGMLGVKFFAAMRPGALFVNTSRAEVVDQDALLKAIEEKGIRAGLDLFEGQPSTAVGEYSGRLKDNPNVYCTHHIGASTRQAQEAVSEEAVRVFRVFAETGEAPNCVNC
ncbi:MAG: hypothetical protein IH851_05835 [Armatimonadetes bacterium]|nr:hypothetical protein [Armatimonadota bacterium]